MTGENTFDRHLPDWKTWQSQPWTRLRYSMTQKNLLRHLPQRRLRILDIGGGNGLDSLPLARGGHAVVLVDSSPEMLQDARQNALDQGVLEQFSFHHADLAALPTLFPEPTFDLILCHNVIQYVQDLEVALQAVCHPLSANGLLSLMSVNRYSDFYRALINERDPLTIRAELDKTEKIANMFAVPVRRYTGEELIEPLQRAGCQTIAHYGIRCVFDYFADNEVKSEPAAFAQLEQLEEELTGRYPYYLLARFFQLIACREAPHPTEAESEVK